MRKCRSEFGRKIFSISRAIITTVFAHGAFGFLLAFPIRELLLRLAEFGRGVWSFALPVAIILAVSDCFEIIESIVAEIVAPGKGVQWLVGRAMNGTPRTIWSRRSSVRCLWWVSLRCCNGRRLALASILRLGETHARAAVRAQEWVGERRTQSETHSLIRTHAIAKHFLPIAVVCYVAFWIALAIHPLDRSDWLLENLLAVILLKGATAERRAGRLKT